MAIGIIDPLEVIAIKEEERERLAVATGASRFLFQAIEQCPVVGKLGEWIGGGKGFQLGVGPVQLPVEAMGSPHGQHQTEEHGSSKVGPSCQ